VVCHISAVTILEYADEAAIVDMEAGYSLELCKPAVPSCSEPSPALAASGLTVGVILRLSDCQPAGRRVQECSEHDAVYRWKWLVLHIVTSYSNQDVN
jgi:hypothetical protein